MDDTAHSKQGDTGAFRAVLTPHRSLSPAGFIILMTAVSLISFVVGLVFFLSGAWPVIGFCGLDVLLIYVAFKLNYRAGRRYEIVELTQDELVLVRVHPSGRCERFAFNPYWARLRLQIRHDGRPELKIVSHGEELTFGSFLTDDEKRDFAVAMQEALLFARGGTRI
jgi:uncharacterized membrane protein